MHYYTLPKKKGFCKLQALEFIFISKPNLGPLCCYALPMMINWLIDEKTKLILWKLSSIQIKI